MDNMIKKLVDILNKELSVYKDILEVSTKKTKVIINGAAKELDKITQVEQTMILQIGRLENERENLVDNIKKQLKIEEDDVSISKIIDNLKDEYKVEIENIRKELLDILNKIKERNELNSMLINDSLEYINFNLNLLANTSAETTYSDKVNKNNEKANSNLFDAKV